MMVDIEAIQSMETIVGLPQMKDDPGLEGMPLLAKGQRLSVQPVSPEHFHRVCQLGGLEV
jgi:predicted RNA-binding protein with PUA-like domain